MKRMVSEIGTIKLRQQANETITNNYQAIQNES